MEIYIRYTIRIRKKSDYSKLHSKYPKTVRTAKNKTGSSRLVAMN